MSEYQEMESTNEIDDVPDGNKRKKTKKCFNIDYKLFICAILILIIIILTLCNCYRNMNQMKEQLEKIQKEIPSKLLPKV